ncbi:MAG: hypothetical protein V1911_01075 [Candidatus Micrarchaeota archaeon]
MVRVIGSVQAKKRKPLFFRRERAESTIGLRFKTGAQNVHRAVKGAVNPNYRLARIVDQLSSQQEKMRFEREARMKRTGMTYEQALAEESRMTDAQFKAIGQLKERLQKRGVPKERAEMIGNAIFFGKEGSQAEYLQFEKEGAFKKRRR